MKFQILYLLIALSVVSCVLKPKNETGSMSPESLKIKLDSAHFQISPQTQQVQHAPVTHHMDTAVLMRYHHPVR